MSYIILDRDKEKNEPDHNSMDTSKDGSQKPPFRIKLKKIKAEKADTIEQQIKETEEAIAKLEKELSDLKAQDKIKRKMDVLDIINALDEYLQHFEPIAKLHQEKFGRPFEENFKRLESGGTLGDSPKGRDSSYCPRDHQLRAIRQYRDGLKIGKVGALLPYGTGTGKTNILRDIFYACLDYAIRHDLEDPKLLFISLSRGLYKQVKKAFLNNMPALPGLITRISKDRITFRNIRKKGRGTLATKWMEQAISANITYAMLQTLCSKRTKVDLDLNQFTLFALDEAHNSLSPERMKFLHQILELGKPFLSATATPITSKYSAYHIYGYSDETENPIAPFELVAAVEEGVNAPIQNYLVIPKDENGEQIDLEFQLGSNGEVTDEEVAKKIDKEPFNKALVDLYMTEIDHVTGDSFLGKKTMVKCAGVLHSEHVAKEFNSISGGVDTIDPKQILRKKYADNVWKDYLKQKEREFKKSKTDPNRKFDAEKFKNEEEKIRKFAMKSFSICECIHSNLEPHECERILKKFKLGGCLVIAGPRILDEGIDDPEVEVLIKAVPSMSDKVTTQTAGRADRLWPEKPHKIAFIIEIAWNPNACFLFEQFKGNKLYVGDVDRCRDHVLLQPPNEIFIQSKHYELQAAPWKIISEFEIDELAQELGPKRKKLKGLAKQRKTKKSSRDVALEPLESSTQLQQTEWLKHAMLEIKKLIDMGRDPGAKIGRKKSSLGIISDSAKPDTGKSSPEAEIPMEIDSGTQGLQSSVVGTESGEGDSVDLERKLQKILEKARKCLSNLENELNLKKPEKSRTIKGSIRPGPEPEQIGFQELQERYQQIANKLKSIVKEKSDKKIENPLDKKPEETSPKHKPAENGSPADKTADKGNPLDKPLENGILKLQQEIAAKTQAPMEMDTKPDSGEVIQMPEIESSREEEASHDSPLHYWLEQNRDLSLVDCIGQFKSKYVPIAVPADKNLDGIKRDRYFFVTFNDVMEAIILARPAALYEVHPTTKNTALHTLVESYEYHDDRLLKLEFLISKFRARGFMVNAKGTTAIHDLMSQSCVLLREGLAIVDILGKFGLKRIMLRNNREGDTPLMLLFEKVELGIKKCDFEAVYKLISLIQTLNPKFFHDKSAYLDSTRLGYIYAAILHRVEEIPSDYYARLDMRYQVQRRKFYNGYIEIQKIIFGQNKLTKKQMGLSDTENYLDDALLDVFKEFEQEKLEKLEQARKDASKPSRIIDPKILALQFLNNNKGFYNLAILFTQASLKDNLIINIYVETDKKKIKNSKMTSNQYEVHPVSLLEVVRAVISKTPAALKYVDRVNGNTIMHVFAHNILYVEDGFEILNLLAKGDKSAVMKSKNNKGDTPLHIALKINEFNVTPSMEAPIEKYSVLIRELLKRYPDLGLSFLTRNKKNETVFDVIFQELRIPGRSFAWKHEIIQILIVFFSGSISAEKLEVCANVLRDSYQVFETEFMKLYNSKKILSSKYYDKLAEQMIQKFCNLFNYIGENLHTITIYNLQQQTKIKFMTLFKKLEMEDFVPEEFIPSESEISNAAMSLPEPLKLQKPVTEVRKNIEAGSSAHSAIGGQTEDEAMVLGLRGFGTYSRPQIPDYPAIPESSSEVLPKPSVMRQQILGFSKGFDFAALLALQKPIVNQNAMKNSEDDDQSEDDDKDVQNEFEWRFGFSRKFI